MSEKRIAISLDTSPGHAQIEELNKASLAAQREMLTNARRTATVLRGLAQASGIAFGEVLTLAFESAILVAETITAMQLAIAASPAGLAGLSLGQKFVIGSRFALAGSLMLKAYQIQEQKRENARRTQGVITALTVFTY